ncbi:MAG TPA: hypothetical protein VG897_11780, partial [Terriglobales bacterium]|nr:hypothetical protein [Terriglobales bacterium]
KERDLRQLLWHRQKLVWMRNAVGNQLHALAMGEGICRKKQLFTKKGRAELEGLAPVAHVALRPAPYHKDRWPEERRSS